MAERTAVSPHARPIVADPEASLSHRPYHVRRTRLWPLWWLCILLFLALSALAAFGWWKSQQLEQQLGRLQGELSNVHARLDGEQEGKQQGDEVSSLAARFDRFESEQGRRGEDVEARLASITEKLESFESRIEQQAGSAARDESIAEARNSRLATMQTSLDALEQTGKEAREALNEQQGALSERQQSQQQALARLDDRLQVLEDNTPEHQAEIETRLEAMEAELADLSTSDDAAAQQLAELAREIQEIRQSQLVINAKLEGMAL